ncbi:hypothetical protein PPYR_06103 [Photinus pyralis]|uniref:Ubiquitin-like protein 7 n=2 Tax=Photinus pyralis TaxID=7054 RepID=A0A5N4ASV7_PHOPY|nr:ubiquitin-like protein 7 [Photinus pyralis]KAB0800363.1 hypothetical protein PPYR_06103 [Photinus pyralis]
MCDNIVLGVRLQPNQYQRIKLDNINLDNNVGLVKDEAAKTLNVEKQRMELVYCGIILEDNSTLSSYGVKSGVTLHVLEKKVPVVHTKVKPISETDVQQLVVAFRSFLVCSGYRAALHKLSRPNVLDNIITSTPGLAEDPVAIAIIRDSELIMQLADPDTVRSIGESHPALIDAAHRIAAFVSKETQSTPFNTQASTSSGYSYSLEALSDDEDMESPNETAQEAAPLTRNSSYNAITAAQLAAAIANATTATYGLSSSPGNTSSTPTGGTNNIITSEMFSNAMQQAFALSQNQTPPTNRLGSPSVPEGFEAMTRRLQPQLQQMREMGLVNEVINIRALQTTSGDVQAAIELVLSGAFS